MAENPILGRRSDSPPLCCPWLQLYSCNNRAFRLEHPAIAYIVGGVTDVFLML
jgi:hypothetical protein